MGEQSCGREAAQVEHSSGGGRAHVIELSGNKDYSLGTVPNVTVELIPQAKHPTHPPPYSLVHIDRGKPNSLGASSATQA